jgi:uncharacterized protein YecT (DUF1311 family)
MRRREETRVRLAATFFAGVALWAGANSAGADQDCWADAKKQSDANLCAENEYREADAELNRVYRAVLAVGKNDFKRLTREAQRAWLKYRDAHFAAVYPSGYYYATKRPMCERLILLRMTQARTVELRRFLPDHVDEDICNHYGPEDALPKQ